jgi:hypothetical protein
MLSFADAASVAAAPTHAPNDPVLQRLLADRIHDWAATDLLRLTHLLVVEAGDSEKDIVEEVAFSPFVNSLDGARFGSPGFQPPFDWMEAHPGWFELIQTVGNDGFAFVLFVEDAPGTDRELVELCRAYAERPTETAVEERTA